MHIQIGIQNVHTRNSADVPNIHDASPNGQNGRIKEERRIRNNLAQEPHLGRLERIQRIGISLGNIISRRDAVIHHHQRAPIASLGTSCDGDGLEEIIGAISGEGGGGPHGTDNDDRLVAVDGGVEEEGGFLERVGAVGDDRAGHGGVVADDVVDGLGETEEDGGGDVFAADVGDLDAGNVGLGGHLGHGVD